MEEITVGIVDKSGIEEVRVIISEWKGKTNLNVRIFANYDIASDPKRPTKKGFVLGINKLPEFAKVINEALSQAEEMGLIEEEEEEDANIE